MKKLFSFCCVSLFLWVLAACSEARFAGKVDELRCEDLENPLGLDCSVPRLSWQITSRQAQVMQTAYCILVASSLEKLEAGKGDCWDSGKVNSDSSLWIPYGGKTLQSRSGYYWKVRVWTNKGMSDWSEPACWTTGLMHPSDWKAQWIGLDKSYSSDRLEGSTRLAARYLRKEFQLQGKPVSRAMLYLSGLGLYEAYVNGKNVDEGQALSPAPTDYSKVVKYNTFDLTSVLKPGDNAIGVVLGNGRFFSMRQPGIRQFGFPKLILQLEVNYADGSRQLVVSDTTWRVTADGPIRANSEFDGEEYDARMEMPGWNAPGFDASRWLPAEAVQAPGGRLEGQENRNIRVMAHVHPVKISQLKPGVYIMDMGQNMVGRLQMSVVGKAGQQVTLRFAETLKPDGSLYTANLRSAQATDKYTLRGHDFRPEVWHPDFTYHGFRFVEITGYPGKPSIGNF
ncbi:MAG: family 78 glycoside hydrolase catalytic domain, partial [Tannerella sp.]|nr:family 78 glycoside hydrolase catalytic domain [Tannerella sp.]